MTPLRQRMIEDMQLRNLSPRTIDCYVRQVALFARHFKRSPELLALDDIRAYQVHLVHHRKLAWSSFNRQSAPSASSIARRSARIGTSTASRSPSAPRSCRWC